mgnify:CR=1 FL=1
MDGNKNCCFLNRNTYYTGEHLFDSSKITCKSIFIQKKGD